MSISMEFAREVARNPELAADFGQEALQYVLGEYDKLTGNQRKCPYCGSSNVIMFDSNEDKCMDCKQLMAGT
jgi:ribosomal protein S27AE